MPVFETFIHGLQAPTDTGASARDGHTKHVAPILVGSNAPGATVQIVKAVGGVETPVGDATVVGHTWTFALPATEGAATYKAVASHGGTSDAFEVRVDRTATAPTAQLADGVLLLHGSAEPGAIVQVFDGATGPALGVVTADAGGAWTLSLAALADGPHQLWASAIDRANNKSAKVLVASIDVDTTVPAGVPTLVLTSGSGGSAGPESGLTVAGTAPAAGAVEILVAGVAVGTAQAVWDGSDFVWGFSVPAATLPGASDPALAVSARLVGDHGQRGASATLQVDWDVTGPGAGLAVTQLVGDQAFTLTGAGPFVTNSLRPTLSGTADADVVRVEVRGADGRLIGEAPVTAGAWSFSAAGDWVGAGGETLALTGYDAAGNPSGTAAVGIAADVVAPAMPSVQGFDAPAALPGGGPSNVAGAVIAHLRGSAAGAAAVYAYDGQTLLAQADVRLDGTWSLQLPTSVGVGPLAVDLVATDAVGNVSQARTYAYTRSLDGPTAPTLTLVGDGRADDAILATNDGAAFAFEGTAGPDVARAVLLVGGVEVDSVAPGLGGAFSVQSQHPLTEGSHAVAVVLVGHGGNETRLDRTVLVDTSAPATPSFDATLVSATPDPVLTGTAEPNSWLTLTDASGPIATTQADGSGTWSVAFPGPMPDGLTAFSVAASDAAGNVGPARAGTVDVRAAAIPGLAITSVQGDADPTAAVLTPLSAPVLRGSAEAGSAIAVTWDGQTRTTAAAADGTWAVQLALTGSTTVVVEATDRFGHVSTATQLITVGAALPAPTGPFGLDPTTDSAALGDAITNNPLPAFQGVEAPNATVLLLLDGVLVEQASADATTGAWRIPAQTALAQGEHVAQLVLRDGAGNLSDPSAPFAFTVDLQAEVAVAAGFTPDTGFSGADKVTNAADVTLAGQSEPGATIALTHGAQAYSTVADGAGAWTFDLPVPTDGAQTVQLLHTDLAGNTAAESVSFRADRSTAGSTASVPAFAPGVDNGLSTTDGLAYAASGLTFVGSAVDAAEVQLYLDGTLFTSIATDFDRDDQDGTLGLASWELQIPGLAPGPHTLRAAAVDLAGNAAASSAAFAFEVMEPLDAPTLAFAPGMDPDGDGYTSSRFAGLTGHADADTDAITIRVAGRPDMTVDLTDEANFTLDGGSKLFELPVPVTLVEGANLITAIAHDTTSGRDAEVSATFHLDRTAPSTPTLTALSPAKPGAPAATIDPTPTLAGTVSEAGATITVKRGATVLGTAVSVAGAEGQPATWELPLTAPLTSGANALTIQARDRMGLAGPILATSLTYDDAVGARPTIGIREGDNGASATDNLLSSATITLGGQLNGAPAVELLEDGVPLADVTVVLDGVGGWSAAIPSQLLTETTHAYAVRVAGGGGDVAASPLAVTVDQSVETTEPAIAGSLSDGFSLLTGAARPVFSGSTEPGTSLRIRLVRTTGSVEVGTADVVANEQGTWTWTPGADVPSGAYYVHAEILGDLAGNTSVGELTFFVVDRSIDTPTLTAMDVDTTQPGYTAGEHDFRTSDDTPSFSGQAQPGAKVELLVDGAVVATEPDAGSSWQLGAGTLLDGTYAVSVRATDPLGNVAESAPREVVIDRVGPIIQQGGLSVASDTGVGGLHEDDGVTRGPAIVVRGSAASGLLVAIDEVLVGTASFELAPDLTAAGTDGTWAFALAGDAGLAAAMATASGTVQVRGSFIDEIGNVGPAGVLASFTLDNAAPGAIATIARLAPGDDDGAADGLTTVSHPTFEGSAGALDVPYVTLYAAFAGGQPVALGTTAVTAGAWSFKAAAAFAQEGAWQITARPLDAAGNEGAAGPAFAYTLDQTGATAVAIGDVSPESPATPWKVTSQTPTLSGTSGEAGGRVSIYDGPTWLGATTTEADGSWTMALPTLDPGGHVLTATLVDRLGQGAAMAARAIDVDIWGDALPTIVALDEHGEPTDGIGRTRQLDASGPLNGALDVLVMLERPGGASEFVPAVVGGTEWRIDGPVALLAEGTYTLHVTGYDADGLPATASHPLIVDLTPPSAGMYGFNAVTPNGVPLTNDATPTYNGHADPDGMVEVTVRLGAATAHSFNTSVDGAGSWSYTLGVTSALATAGTYTASLRATDAAGNTTPTAQAVEVPFVFDNAGPALTIGSITPDSTGPGGSAGDFITNATHAARILGTAEAGSTVSVRLPGGPILATQELGTTATAYDLALGITVPEGARTFEVTATDRAGNTTYATQVVTFDRTAPTISNVALAATSDTGHSATDRVTNADTLAFTGKTEPGAQVTLRLGTTSVAGSVAVTALADGSGNWAATITDPAFANTNIVGARALVNVVDMAGNGTTSVASAMTALTFDIDNIPPTNIATITALAVTSDTGYLSHDRVTRETMPRVEGTVPQFLASADNITVYGYQEGGSAIVLGTTAITGTTWNFTPPTAMAEGVWQLWARQTDDAGNLGPTPNSNTYITIDRTPHPAGALSWQWTDIGLGQQGYTDDRSLGIAGTIAGVGPVSEVIVSVTRPSHTSVVSTFVTNGSGAFSGLLLPLPDADGAYDVEIWTRDQAGNTSPSTFTSLTLDRVAPSATGSVLGLGPTHDTGTDPDDNITADARPQLTGTVSSTLNVGYAAVYGVRNGGPEVLLGTAPLSGTTWSFEPTTAMADGSWSISAAALDYAGNPGPRNPAFAFTLDTVAPSLAGLTVAATDFSSGSATLTGDRTHGFAGNLPGAPANTEIVFTPQFAAGVSSVRLTTDANGNFTGSMPTLPNASGSYDYAITVRDPAGNLAPGSVTRTVTLDVTPPPAPVITNTNHTPHFGRIALIGTAEANGTVLVHDGARLLGTTTADAGGVWTFRNYDNNLVSGVHTITATARDAVGNLTVGNSLNVTVVASTHLLLDLDPPALYTTEQVHFQVVSGSNAIPGERVYLLSQDAVAMQTFADAEGRFSFSFYIDYSFYPGTNNLNVSSSGRETATYPVYIDDMAGMGDLRIESIPGTSVVVDAASFGATDSQGLGPMQIRVVFDSLYGFSAGSYFFFDSNNNGVSDAGEILNAGSILNVALLNSGRLRYYDSGAGDGKPFVMFRVEAADGSGREGLLQVFNISRRGVAYKLGDQPPELAEAPEGADWCAIAIDYDAFASSAGSYAGIQPVAPEALLDGDALAGQIDLEALIGPPPASGERIEEVYGPQPADILADGEALRRMLEQQQLMVGMNPV